MHKIDFKTCTLSKDLPCLFKYIIQLLREIQWLTFCLQNPYWKPKALLYSVWFGKNGAWQGNYVNRLFYLNWRSCWFLFHGLVDGYYVALLLVQTSQVLLAFMCFDWLWLHVLLHSRLRFSVSGGEKLVTPEWSYFQGWKLDGAFWFWKYFMTSALRNCFLCRKVVIALGTSVILNQSGIWVNCRCIDWLKTHHLPLSLKELIAVNCFVTLRQFLFCQGLVSVLALLGVDCAVATGNGTHGAVPLFSVCVCVHVPIWLGGIAGQLFTS